MRHSAVSIIVSSSHYSECRHAECRCAECRGAPLNKARVNSEENMIPLKKEDFFSFFFLLTLQLSDLQTFMVTFSAGDRNFLIKNAFKGTLKAKRRI